MIIIGIAGPSGSGKTTLAMRVKDYVSSAPFRKTVAILSLDAYYCDQSHLTLTERSAINYDEPAAFDYPLVISHLRDFIDGKSIAPPIFDYPTFSRKSVFDKEISPCDVLIIEGILIYANKELSSLIDLRFFLDVRLDLCLSRRLERDIIERGSALVERGIRTYSPTIMPMCDQHVLPQKRKATHILRETDCFTEVETILKTTLFDWTRTRYAGKKDDNPYVFWTRVGLITATLVAGVTAKLSR